MSKKRVDAYFPNKDDAQSAMIKLQVSGADNVTMETFQTGHSQGYLLPIAPSFGSTGQGNLSSGVNGALPFMSYFSLPDGEQGNIGLGNENIRKTLVSFSVAEHKLSAIIDVVKNCGGYIDG